MGARYHLVTRLGVGAERPILWSCLSRVEDWPRWWRWLIQVEVVREGAEDGVGSVFYQRITSPLRYGFGWRTEILQVEEGSLVDLASYGALDGHGRFTLADIPGGTEVSFLWLVETGEQWMNLLAPFARPVFIWSHNRLMDDFARGLAGEAGSELMWVRHEARAPGEAGFFEMPARTE